eukprot:TRINITY_DN5721_c0_g1_i2.p1 TRINITY_DN5721_c0_g1~~TRINITY_DN5721_c0_g1_i2.p1  ORF type:complete len:474 (-),score=78.91 TRINITY_DN5721_c0_g1_i2:256-1677(-)
MVSPWCVVLALVCCWGVSGDLRGGDPVAYSNFGKVRGINKDGLASFLGIPYAVPPTGPLRWKPPKPFYLKDREFAATTESPICPQFGYPFNTTLNESEDCLYLNIYTKHFSPRSRKPVLFWIHGGSLIFGSAYMYKAQNLAKELDVVVVSINYRLNAFGFLALRELNWGDPRRVSGNYGIMDQQLALSWVRENIAAFGGDPHRVTLLGQSSGGTSIYALMSSPASRGLFHAAIAMSGSANITMGFPEVNKQNRAFLSASSCDNLAGKETLECIYGLTTAEVLQATPGVYNFIPLAYPFPSDKRAGMQYPGVVYVDGVTVKYPFLKAIRKPLIDVPLLLQSASNELEVFNSEDFSSLSNAEMKEQIAGSMAPGFGVRAGEEVAYAYFSNGHTAPTGTSPALLPRASARPSISPTSTTPSRRPTRTPSSPGPAWTIPSTSRTGGPLRTTLICCAWQVARSAAATRKGRKRGDWEL